MIKTIKPLLLKHSEIGVLLSILQANTLAGLYKISRANVLDSVRLSNVKTALKNDHLLKETKTIVNDELVQMNANIIKEIHEIILSNKEQCIELFKKVRQGVALEIEDNIRHTIKTSCSKETDIVKDVLKANDIDLVKLAVIVNSAVDYGNALEIVSNNITRFNNSISNMSKVISNVDINPNMRMEILDKQRSNSLKTYSFVKSTASVTHKDLCDYIINPPVYKTEVTELDLALSNINTILSTEVINGDNKYTYLHTLSAIFDKIETLRDTHEAGYDNCLIIKGLSIEIANAFSEI